MSLQIIYWILMLLWLIGAASPYVGSTAQPRPGWGLIAGNVVLFFLLLILGWQVFGAPVK